MGWDGSYSWRSRQDVVKEITETETQSNGTKWETIAHCVRGTVFWGVVEITKPSGEKERFIRCTLIEKHGRGADAMWMKKDMEESMGVYYYSCPPKYFDMVPCPNDTAAGWRDAVVKQGEAAKAKRKAVKTAFKSGDTVQLVKGCKPAAVTFVAMKGKSLVGYGPDGRRYRVAMKYIAPVETPVEA